MGSLEGVVVAVHAHKLDAVVDVRCDDGVRAVARCLEHVHAAGAVEYQGRVAALGERVGSLEGVVVAVHADQLDSVAAIRGHDGVRAVAYGKGVDVMGAADRAKARGARRAARGVCGQNVPVHAYKLGALTVRRRDRVRAVAYGKGVDADGAAKAQRAAVGQRAGRLEGAVLVHAQQLDAAAAVARRGDDGVRAAVRVKGGHGVRVLQYQAAVVEYPVGRRKHGHGAPAHRSARGCGRVRGRKGGQRQVRVVARAVPNRTAGARGQGVRAGVGQARGRAVAGLHCVVERQRCRAAAARVGGVSGRLGRQCQRQRGRPLHDDRLVERDRKLGDAARAVRAFRARRRGAHGRRRRAVHQYVPRVAERAGAARHRQGQEHGAAAPVLPAAPDMRAPAKGQRVRARIVQVGGRVALPHRVPELQRTRAVAAGVRGVLRRVRIQRQLGPARDGDRGGEPDGNGDSVVRHVRRVAAGRVDAYNVRRRRRIHRDAALVSERAGVAGRRQGGIDGIPGPVPQARAVRLQRARPRVVQAVGIHVARLHRVVECKRARVVARRVQGRPVRAPHVEDQRRRRIGPRDHDGLVKVDVGYDPVARGIRPVGRGRRNARHDPRRRRHAHIARCAERAGRAGLGQF